MPRKAARPPASARRSSCNAAPCVCLSLATLTRGAARAKCRAKWAGRRWKSGMAARRSALDCSPRSGRNHRGASECNPTAPAGSRRGSSSRTRTRVKLARGSRCDRFVAYCRRTGQYVTWPSEERIISKGAGGSLLGCNITRRPCRLGVRSEDDAAVLSKRLVVEDLHGITRFFSIIAK